MSPVTLKDLTDKLLNFMSSFKTIFRSIRPFLGKLEVEIDRTRQLISFKKNGKTEILTVDQLFDEIESIFQATRPATGLPGKTTNLPKNRPSWLSNYDKPITSPLVLFSQAVIEPARPLAAHQVEDRRLS